QRGECGAHRPERVELRADRRLGAASTGRHVAQRRRAADVGLELDLRVRFPVSLEWPDVLERRWMVPRPIRPAERYVIESVEVKVTVLEPGLDALVRGRELGRRYAVDHRDPGALLEAITIGELTERTADRIIGRAGDRAVRSLGRRVLADARGRV